MKKTITQLKKTADKIFSKYIRARDAGICFTCGIKKEPKQQQNGHYVSRSHNNTRFDEENCHCQCMQCNIFKSGNMDEYALKLQRKYGKGILEKLNKKKQIHKSWTEQELMDLIKTYKNKLKQYEL